MAKRKEEVVLDLSAAMREFFPKVVEKGFRLNDLEDDGFFKYEAIREGGGEDYAGVRVVIAVGPNGSGKSLIGRLMESVVLIQKKSFRMVSMKNRTSGEMGQRLVFGCENDQATGLNTVGAVGMLLKSIQQEALAGGGGGLDEPTLGLSPEFSGAVGQEVARVLGEAQNHYLFVASHDRVFLRGLVDGLRAAGIGWLFVEFECEGEPQGADAWLGRAIVARSWAELEEREKKAFKMWRKVETLLRG